MTVMPWFRIGGAAVDLSKPAIEMIEATVMFNRGTVSELTVLRDVNISIPSKAIMVVTGGNGSGKSTLLKAIAGSVPLARGRVLIHGIDVTNWSMRKRARLISFVHQDPLLGTSPNLSVFDNIDLVSEQPWWWLLPRRFALTKAQSSLLDGGGIHLYDKAAAPVSTLSGGQRQILAIKISMMLPSRIRLLDEIFSSLSEAVVAEVIRNFTSCESTLLYVTHSSIAHSSIKPDGVISVADKMVSVGG